MIALFAALSVLGCHQSAGRKERNRAEEVKIGNIEVWNQRPYRLLVQHGFPKDMEVVDLGLISLTVPRNRANEAYRLLTTDCKKKGYWLAIRNPSGKMETFNKQNDAAYAAWEKRTFFVHATGEATSRAQQDRRKHSAD